MGADFVTFCIVLCGADLLWQVQGSAGQIVFGYGLLLFRLEQAGFG